MKTHRLTEDYTRAFQTFLSHTTEKQDLLVALQRKIEAAQPISLLDIGAGNGDLAIPLSRLVRDYVAIESNLEYAIQLRMKGLEVFEAPFPWKTVGGAFAVDFVLASHVVPWEEDQSKAFLRAAWRCLNPGGTFAMITYDEENSPWGSLLYLSGLPVETIGQGHFNGYKKLLASLGTLEVETIMTQVVAKSMDEMLDALSFVYGDGQLEKQRQFQESSIIRGILGSCYYTDGQYRFPLTHYLLQAKKSK